MMQAQPTAQYATMTPTLIDIKSQFGNDKRRFRCAAHLPTITSHLESVYGLTAADTLQLKYVDDEGDEITLSNDDDLATAVRISGTVLRLVVAGPTPTPTESTPGGAPELPSTPVQYILRNGAEVTLCLSTRMVQALKLDSDSTSDLQAAVQPLGLGKLVRLGLLDKDQVCRICEANGINVPPVCRSGARPHPHHPHHHHLGGGRGGCGGGRGRGGRGRFHAHHHHHHHHPGHGHTMTQPGDAGEHHPPHPLHAPPHHPPHPHPHDMVVDAEDHSSAEEAGHDDGMPVWRRHHHGFGGGRGRGGRHGRGGGGRGGGGGGCPRKIMARFVKHITVPDGEAVVADSSFVKTWRFRNDHNQAWPANVEILWTGGDSLGLSAPVAVRGAVEPGAEADVSVNLTAPTKAGTYQAFFRLREVGGRKFGQQVWAAVTVTASSSESDDVADFVDVAPVPTNPRLFDQPDVAMAPAAAVPTMPPTTTTTTTTTTMESNYETALVQLQEMGFDNTPVNARLLTRYRGNVERVIARLTNNRQGAH